MDVGKVHLHAVFGLVCICGHGVKFLRSSQFIRCLSIDCQIAEGSGIFGVCGEGTAWEIECVRGAEEDYSFAVREVERSVGPSCGGSGV